MYFRVCLWILVEVLHKKQVAHCAPPASAFTAHMSHIHHVIRKHLAQCALFMFLQFVIQLMLGKCVSFPIILHPALSDCLFAAVEVNRGAGREHFSYSSRDPASSARGRPHNTVMNFSEAWASSTLCRELQLLSEYLQ